MTGVDAVRPGTVPAVLPRVAPGQVGALPVARIVGLLVLVVVATGVLIVAFRTARDRESGDEDDDDGGLYDPGPAYGPGGTSDVTEVLQVEPEDDGDEEDEEDEVAMPDEGFDHSVVGPRNEGLLVEVTGEGGTGKFLVEDPEATVPDVVPASPRGGSDRDWTVDAVAYLREQEFDVPFDSPDDDGEWDSTDPDPDDDGVADRADPDDDGVADQDGDPGPEFDHEVRGERTRGYLVTVTDGVASAEFFVRHVESPNPTVEPASSRERRHGERWTRLAESYLRERAVAGELLEDLEVERE